MRITCVVEWNFVGMVAAFDERGALTQSIAQAGFAQ
jgi:hypothetical protein